MSELDRVGGGRWRMRRVWWSSLSWTRGQLRPTCSQSPPVVLRPEPVKIVSQDPLVPLIYNQPNKEEKANEQDSEANL